MVVQEESPLHPSVGLTEAAARLLLAGLLFATIALCALALRFLLQHGQSLKLVSRMFNLRFVFKYPTTAHDSLKTLCYFECASHG